MTKLKLGPIHDDKPVKLTVELPADVHRDLCDYAAVFGPPDWTGAGARPPRGPHAGPFLCLLTGIRGSQKISQKMITCSAADTLDMVGRSLTTDRRTSKVGD